MMETVGVAAPCVPKRARKVAEEAPRLVVEIDPIPPAKLKACARVLARLAVEKAQQELGLDFSQALGDHVGNSHKTAPPGVEAPNGAKEQVT
jgi:hypothetical protein